MKAYSDLITIFPEITLETEVWDCGEKKISADLLDEIKFNDAHIFHTKNLKITKL